MRRVHLMAAGRVLAMAMVALIAQGCAGITVGHEFDPDANFAAYGSYDWLPTESRRVDLRVRDPMVEQNIRSAIEVELLSKGLRKVERGGEPDIRIGYLLTLEDGVESNSMYERSGGDWQYRTYGPANLTTQTQAFSMGTLVIDVFDVSRRELVWRGVAEGQVKQTRELEDQRKRLNDAVGKILEDFPPGN
jgi:hypothetical protein